MKNGPGIIPGPFYFLFPRHDYGFFGSSFAGGGSFFSNSA